MTSTPAPLSRRERLSGDRRRLVGVVMGLSYGSGWAACTVWLRRMMDTYRLEPVSVIFWRDVIISLLLFLVVFSRGGLRLQRRHVPVFILFGFVGITLNNLSWGFSVNLNGVTVATVLAYSAPVFTVLLSRPLFGERITRRKLGSLVLALSGCLVVSQVYDLGNSSLTPLGIGVALAVGLTQAGRDLLGKAVCAFYPALTGIFFGFLFGTVFLGITQLQRGGLPRLPTFGWLELVLMSGGVGASYALYLGAISRLPVSVVSIMGLSEALMAALLAYLAYGETLAPLQIAGAVLVISGVALLEVRAAEGVLPNDGRC